MRILVAVDDVKTGMASIQAAAARPWPSGSLFCLLNVFKPFPFTSAPIVQERWKEKVLRNLEAVAAPLRTVGWDTTVELCTGSPAREINTFAEVWRADLIMLGCNELNDLLRLFLGSTARSVVRHASCSVEIVRPCQIHGVFPEGSGMRILVATDGSECSLTALHSVAQRPWPPNSIAKVISAPEFILLKDPSYLETHEVKDLGEAASEEARISVAAGVGILSGTALKVLSAVPAFQDRPHKVILHEAEQWPADLIVVGSHGRSGFDRVIMGSVSEAVALHAPCSVEVIRQRSAQP